LNEFREKTMTPELQYLLWAAALTFVQMLVSVILVLPQASLPTLAGNRDDMPEAEGIAGRAVRAHRNMLESLVLFAILVLVAKAANVSNAMTLLGAQLFFWSRLAYAVVYVIGLPWVRTAIWAVSVVGLLLMFLQLI
jgi:uncharacterized MAPEG superfamily protein